MFTIVSGPVDPKPLEEKVAWSGAGAILTFSGVARDNFQGKDVVALEYEAYETMAVPIMKQIGDEVQKRWPTARIAMAHTTGRLEIGEASVVISVATAHRGEAYDVSRYAIDELKARVPVWKREIYKDGAVWKSNPESGRGIV